MKTASNYVYVDSFETFYMKLEKKWLVVTFFIVRHLTI